MRRALWLVAFLIAGSLRGQCNCPCTPTPTRTPTPTATRTPTPGSSGSVWSKWYGGSGEDAGKAIAVDSFGNVAVAGNFQGTVDFGTGALTSFTGSQDAFVAKYSSTGTAAWAKKLGGDNSDVANGVAVDSGGNVCVTGYQLSSSVDYGGGVLVNHGGTDIFLAKYAGASGGYLWAKMIGGTGYDAGNAVAVDTSGNVIVIGYFEGAVDFGGTSLTSAGLKDVFVAKFSGATGALLWAKRYGSTGQDSANAVAVDASGNVFVTGYFSGAVDFGGGSLTSAGGVDIFVEKISSAAGAYIWAKRYGGTTTDLTRGLVVDGSNDVVVTGQFTGTINFGGSDLTSAGFEDAFLAKLSGTDGAHTWSQRFGSNSTTDSGYGVAVDGSGNVAVTGFYGPSADFGGGLVIAQGYDIFLAKYAATDGAYISAVRYGDPPGEFNGQFGDAIAMTSAGGVYLTGHYVGTLSTPGGQRASTQFGGNDGYLASVGSGLVSQIRDVGSMVEARGGGDALPGPKAAGHERLPIWAIVVFAIAIVAGLLLMQRKK